MSQKDRKKVMDDFKKLNAAGVNVNPAQQPQPGNQEQQKPMTLMEAVQMFSAQLDIIKNNLIGIITKQDSEIKKLNDELQKIKK